MQPRCCAFGGGGAVRVRDFSRTHPSTDARNAGCRWNLLQQTPGLRLERMSDRRIMCSDEG